MVTKPS